MGALYGPSGDGSYEHDGTKVLASKSVVAGGDVTPVLKSLEEAFDYVEGTQRGRLRISLFAE